MSGELPALEERFATLAFRQLEGLATPAERAELALLLRQDVAFLARFAHLARQHGLLSELLGVPGASPAVAVPTPAEPPIGGATQVLRRSSRRVRVFRRRPASQVGWMAAAAAVMLLVLGGVIATWDGRAVVGHLESTAVVRAPSTPVRAGDRVDGSGREYVVLRDGSRIGLSTGTTITVASADRIMLTTGMVLVEAAPRSAAALVVETPQALARVLGTRFTVVAVDGRTQLDVDEGLVRFVRRSDNATLDVPAAAWAEVAAGKPFVIHHRTTAVTTPVADPFVAGVNLNGGAVTIDGNRWWSQREAVDNGLVLPPAVLVTATAVTPTPAVERPLATMLNTAVHRIDQDLPLSLPLADGAYTVEVWLMENFAPGHRSLTITLEGAVVARRVQDGDAIGVWHRLRYPVEVRDGRLDLVIGATGEQAHLMGFSVHRR
ncbi:MAG: FecR domain-containing protein [Planctomycetes bacterium]|nr:FecR domain-containing protein [Planctomycetota bacterium]